MRRMVATGVGIALCGALALPLPASAADGASNWWWDTYGIGAIHDGGVTGKGVKIAMFDVAINPDVPALANADLTIGDPVCSATSPVTTETTEGAVHGTTLAAMLVGNGQGAGAIRGIAPDAQLTFYGTGDETGSDCDVVPYPGDPHPEELSAYGVALQRAVDDGAQVFTSSLGTPGDRDGDIAVIANAIARGVVLVNTTLNYGTAGEGLVGNTVGYTNGVVAASAVDSSGVLQLDDDGTPFIEEATTVVAAGVGVPTVGTEGGTWEQSRSALGSSFAAPLVAGMTALAAQAWPEASGNQLVQSLLRNTNGSTHEPLDDAASGYGYGAAWVASMLQDDPTVYPDENPLMDKAGGRPTAADLQRAVARDSAYPVTDDGRPSFGTDEPAPNPLMPSVGDTLLIVLFVILGIVVVGAIVTVIIVVTVRRGRNPQGGKNDRHV